MSECYVYVIAIEKSGLRKVGISENPDSRLAQLRTGSPFEMTLERTWRLASRTEAATIERKFHKNFSVLRETGEWFRIDWGGAFDGVNCIIAEYVAEDTLIEPSALRRKHLRWRGLNETEAMLLVLFVI